MNRPVEISLAYPFLYKWEQQGPVSLLAQSVQVELFQHFSGITSVPAAMDVLKIAAGNFAVVVNRDPFLFAATDHVRSFPLFYKFSSGQLHISDNIAPDENPVELDGQSAATFSQKFCCEGNSTLLKDWKQLQPGEFLFYDKIAGELSIRRYYDFEQAGSSDTIDTVAMKQIYLDVFSSIIKEAGSRPLIVPLSGGYDSRCIVACLCMLGAKNIFCYTYGRKDSFERRAAEQVAKQLRLNWHFVEYDKTLLDVFLTDTWQQYSDKNHHFSSLPHEQDFFALYELQRQGLLPRDGIVLPGFLGDYFAGSMFKDQPRMDPGAASQYQDRYISNRGCKFIINSVRVFEYFGLEWRIPFADKTILDFWLHISLEKRLYQNGYNDSLSEVFFKPLQIDFRKPDHIYHAKKLRWILRDILPSFVSDLILSFKRTRTDQDPNNTCYLESILAARGDQKLNNMKIGFNEAHARFFLDQLAGKMANFEHKSSL